MNVARRIGGLEMDVSIIDGYFLVARRIGGLEIKPLQTLCTIGVARRIGGLENWRRFRRD